MAAIGSAAALNAGELPRSSGERRILQLAASLAASLAAGIPVDLCDTITGLDNDNTARPITAIRHATEKAIYDSWPSSGPFAGAGRR